MENDYSWIKLFRRLKKKGYYKKSEYVHLWVHLLLSVNYKPNEFLWNNKMIIIKEGQILTGRKQLSEDTGIAETTIERILDLLEKEKQIGQQKTTKFRVITILNWKDYQENGQQTDNKRTTNGQQTDTIKECKKVKNNKNKHYADDSPEIILSKQLYSEILKINRQHKQPSFQRWAKDVDIMIKMDKRTPQQISQMIIFSTHHEFWCRNILSVKALAKHFDRLLIEIKKGKSNGTKQSNGATPDDVARIATEYVIETGQAK